MTLDQKAAWMRDRARENGQTWTQLPQRGLHLYLSYAAQTGYWQLVLWRADRVEPSAQEIQECRQAFGIPADVAPVRIAGFEAVYTVSTSNFARTQPIAPGGGLSLGWRDLEPPPERFATPVIAYLTAAAHSGGPLAKKRDYLRFARRIVAGTNFDWSAVLEPEQLAQIYPKKETQPH